MKRFIYLLFGNTLPQVIVAAAFLWLAKAIDKIQFGQIMLLESVYQGLFIIILFGMDKAMERLSFESNVEEYAGKLLFMSSLLCVILGAGILACYIIVDKLTNISSQMQLNTVWIYLVIVSSMIGAIFQLYVTYNYVLADARTFAILRSARAVIFSISIAVVAISTSAVVSGKIIADILSFLIPLVLFKWLVKRKGYSNAIDVKIIKKALPYSAPFVITLLSSFVINYVDRFFIASYVNPASLADYTLSQRITAVVILVAGGGTLLLPPLFYKNIDKDPDKVFSGIREVMKSCIWLCLIAISLTPIAIDYLYGTKYAASSQYVPLLLVGVYLSIVVSNSTALCLLHEKNSVLNMITGSVTALVSLGINFLLAPVLGAYGAVISYVMAMSILYVMQYSLVKNKYRGLPLFTREFSVLLLLSVLLSYVLSQAGTPGIVLTMVLLGVALFSLFKLSIGIRHASIIKA